MIAMLIHVIPQQFALGLHRNRNAIVMLFYFNFVKNVRGAADSSEDGWLPDVDREGEDKSIRWEDSVKVSTYAKAEVAIVRRWLERGMTLMNGRAPYDEGEGTRDGSVLDYVLTTMPTRVWKLEQHEMSRGHKMTVLRTRDGKGDRKAKGGARKSGQRRDQTERREVDSMGGRRHQPVQ